jgi:hypothetical protein
MVSLRFKYGIWFVSLLCVCLGCEQGRPGVDRVSALKDAKVKAIPGWKEVVSDQGRFRVIFPGEPKDGDQGAGVTSMHGLKMTDNNGHWFVLYVDLDGGPKDEAEARQSYRRSVEELVRKGSKVVSQRDVTINGVLGVELILRNQFNTSFMRAFVVNHRVYTLDVDWKDPVALNSVPGDVQQFFESFTFWQ